MKKITNDEILEQRTQTRFIKWSIGLFYVMLTAFPLFNDRGLHVSLMFSKEPILFQSSDFATIWHSAMYGVVIALYILPALYLWLRLRQGRSKYPFGRLLTTFSVGLVWTATFLVFIIFVTAYESSYVLTYGSYICLLVMLFINLNDHACIYRVIGVERPILRMIQKFLLLLD